MNAFRLVICLIISLAFLCGCKSQSDINHRNQEKGKQSTSSNGTKENNNPECKDVVSAKEKEAKAKKEAEEFQKAFEKMRLPPKERVVKDKITINSAFEKYELDSNELYLVTVDGKKLLINKDKKIELKKGTPVHAVITRVIERCSLGSPLSIDYYMVSLTVEVDGKDVILYP
jgi:hypothetical protein